VSRAQSVGGYDTESVATPGDSTVNRCGCGSVWRGRQRRADAASHEPGPHRRRAV